MFDPALDLFLDPGGKPMLHAGLLPVQVPENGFSSPLACCGEALRKWLDPQVGPETVGQQWVSALISTTLR